MDQENRPAPQTAALPLHVLITRRELEVLTLVSEGLSYSNIARKLAITPRTASFHMVAVRGKFVAKNNPHAVAIAFREGLLGNAAAPLPQKPPAKAGG